jgi:hypothetical protein
MHHVHLDLTVGALLIRWSGGCRLGRSWSLILCKRGRTAQYYQPGTEQNLRENSLEQWPIHHLASPLPDAFFPVASLMPYRLKRRSKVMLSAPTVRRVFAKAVTG